MNMIYMKMGTAVALCRNVVRYAKDIASPPLKFDLSNWRTQTAVTSFDFHVVRLHARIPSRASSLYSLSSLVASTTESLFERRAHTYAYVMPLEI
jgi:hypothetical protein